MTNVKIFLFVSLFTGTLWAVGSLVLWAAGVRIEGLIGFGILLLLMTVCGIFGDGDPPVGHGG